VYFKTLETTVWLVVERGSWGVPQDDLYQSGRWICSETRYLCHVWIPWEWLGRKTHSLYSVWAMLSSFLCKRCGKTFFLRQFFFMKLTFAECFSKVTQVILKKGWRCLDCTVCEGCGSKNDEANLILCDECDISYHIYCMRPPLERVPQGTWKCKWYDLFC